MVGGVLPGPGGQDGGSWLWIKGGAETEGGREREAALWGPRKQAAVVPQVVSASRTLPSSGIPQGPRQGLTSD